MTRIVLASHSRELRMSLFLALDALEDASIVATASSTAELISYCKVLRPDVVIIESGLPGRGLDATIDQLTTYMGQGRILIVDGEDAREAARNHANVEEFVDLSHLLQAVP